MHMAPESANVLPGELRAFLHSAVKSFEQLEILMALRRTGQTASARRLTDELGLPESTVQHHLERLAGQGLLDARLGDEDVLYKYDPLSPDLRRAVDVLAEYYASERTAVVHFVTAGARRSVRDFSAAFRLRGRDRD
jgi:DNA-binding transcriptional ArsR family regulator